MEALVLRFGMNREVDMAKLTKRSIKQINKLKLDNVVHGKLTASTWNKYQSY